MATGVEGAEPNRNLAAALRAIADSLAVAEDHLQVRADRVHQLRRDLDAEIQSLDRVRQKIETLLRLLESRAAISAGLGAKRDVLLLESGENPDGSVTFSINGGKAFSLSPRLAEFFQFITSAEGVGRGGRVPAPWRTKTEVSAYLEILAHRKITSTYINGMVHRIRKVLKNAEYDPRLIQTHRVKGIRFAVDSEVLRPRQRGNDQASADS